LDKLKQRLSESWMDILSVFTDMAIDKIFGTDEIGGEYQGLTYF